MKIKCPICGNENYFSGLEDEETRFCSSCNEPLFKIEKEKNNSAFPVPKQIIDLQRSLEGIQLGTMVGIFESDPVWKEMIGQEKIMFDSGLPDERFFMTSSGDKQFMCGFVLDKVYKVSIVVSISYTKFYLKQFTNKYGDPINEPERGLYIWENNITALELMTSGPQLNIILTDKNLLKKAYGI